MKDQRCIEYNLNEMKLAKTSINDQAIDSPTPLECRELYVQMRDHARICERCSIEFSQFITEHKRKQEREETRTYIEAVNEAILRG